MTDYISREAAIRAIENECVDGKMYGNDDHTLIDPYDVIDEISSLPAADVVPVRHGRWYWADGGYCRCSECGQKAPICDYGYNGVAVVKSLFCPQCGAKMDGEADGYEKQRL